MPRVKLFASLRKAAGLNETDAAGRSIGEVLAALALQHPALDSHLLENGQLRPHVVITINGQPTQDILAPVADEDEIGIFPPIAGG